MRRISILMLVFFACFVLAVWPQAQAQRTFTFTNFKAPGAGIAKGQGTFALDINKTGTIIGYYLDGQNLNHGFVRTPDGTITTFDAPGAGTARWQGTFLLSISSTGAITGYYADTNSVYHGFVLSADGTFTEFDVSGAGTGMWQGTWPQNINTKGMITGSYTDAGNANHGFARTPDGTIQSFDPAGAGTGAGQGTVVAGVDALNNAGTTTGWYIDTNDVEHAFVRTALGVITTFNDPGAGTGAGDGSSGGTINSQGMVAGNYCYSSNQWFPFLIAPDGTITDFSVPAEMSGGAPAMDIGPSGTILGYYFDASGAAHGYMRFTWGNFVLFDDPQAGTASGQGTFPMTFKGGNTITGYYVGPNNVVHGFVYSR